MTRSHWRSWFASPTAVAVAMTIVTALVYAQTLQHDFINFDDEEYVTAEPMVQEGVTLRGIRWALTDVSASNWFPLTRISHMIDCELFGVNPGPHHLVNVLFHLANMLLLLRVLHRMTGALGPSAFVAGAFALHPLHVESVAWISERKDLLSTFFALGTLNLYASYVKQPKAARYIATLAVFALALMAKSMVVTIPCVLLLLDHWPSKRYGTVPLRKIALEKIPFFILAAAVSIITVYAQRQGGAVMPTEHLALTTRLAHAIVAYCVYLQKTFVPVGLGIFYPYPDDPPAVSTLFLCGALLLAVSTSAFVLVRRLPYLFVGWFWFLGMLVPVIGIVQVGNQAMADRYTYLSLTGVFIVLAWGGRDLVARLGRGRSALTAAAIASVAAMTALTALQVRHWQNSETLFRHTIAVTGGSSKAHNNLGTALYGQGQYAEAEAQFRRALAFGPGNIQARNNLGAVLLVQGRAQEALDHFEAVLRANPDDASVHLNMAVALQNLGRLEEALERARHALDVDPSYRKAVEFLETYGDGQDTRSSGQQ